MLLMLVTQVACAVCRQQLQQQQQLGLPTSLTAAAAPTTHLEVLSVFRVILLHTNQMPRCTVIERSSASRSLPLTFDGEGVGVTWVGDSQLRRPGGLQTFCVIIKTWKNPR